jgi:hypothetical protein
LDLADLQLGGTQHRHACGDGLASRVELLIGRQAVHPAVEWHLARRSTMMRGLLRVRYEMQPLRRSLLEGKQRTGWN